VEDLIGETTSGLTNKQRVDAKVTEVKEKWESEEFLPLREKFSLFVQNVRNIHTRIQIRAKIS